MFQVSGRTPKKIARVDTTIRRIKKKDKKPCMAQIGRHCNTDKRRVAAFGSRYDRTNCYAVDVRVIDILGLTRR